MTKLTKDIKGVVEITAVKPVLNFSDENRAIIAPRITEKATAKAAENVYVFNVRTDATKKAIAHAVKKLFNVSPVRVSVTPVRAKKVFRRGKMGRTNSAKKAYVYLKKGDKIEIV